MNEKVISAIKERLKRDPAAFKRVIQSFGIPKKPSRLSSFSTIVRLFPDTPVTMLKDVFEALQLYDLLELLENKSATKPHRSLQLAYTLDEIKKLNGVADLPTTYHSCGAVLIITDDENVSSSSAIKTFFTDLDNESDVTEILIQDTPTLRHLKEEINAMILEIRNLSEGETQVEQTKMSLLRELKEDSDELKHRIRRGVSGVQAVFLRLRQSMDGIVNFLRMKLRLVTDELKSSLQLTIVTAERIQANLAQLIQTPDEWFVMEEKKDKKNFKENVSAVINRWIHRRG